MSITNIGTTVEVSATLPASDDQAGYELLTWTEVEGVLSMGGFGPTHEILNQTYLKDGIVRKAHGSKNLGDPDLMYSPAEAGAGQGILKTALDSQATISIKVSRPSGRVQYCQCIVGGVADDEANANNTTGQTSSIAMSSGYVEVAAP